MSIKIPLTPPPLPSLLRAIDSDRVGRILTAPELIPTTAEYMHWDKLFHIAPPEGFSSQEWWLAIKMARVRFQKPIPLRDTKRNLFTFLVTDPMHEELHRIDLAAGGRIGVPQEIINPETRTQYYVSSLIEEAIASSQLEGAVTTRDVAKQMIREKRTASDRSEQMILNNYAAMQRIGELKDVPLTKAVVLELQSILTDGTLDNPDAHCRFRLPEEDIVVEDPEGTTYHIPPDASELDERIDVMCKFANAETPGYFIHPVLRSIILHFWLAYIHPFVDGNGRTARALFYWSMLHSGFWFCEYISISHIIRRAPIKYARAFLLTETDDNDLTYFMMYHVEVLKQALTALDEYIHKKSATMQAVERDLRMRLLLNHRQRALMSHALRHPGAVYSTKGHQTSHNVSFHTARLDLMTLAQEDYLLMTDTRPTLFIVPNDLEARLTKGAPVV